MAILATTALTLLILGAVIFAPRNRAGQRPLISAYNVTLALYVIYAILPAVLIIANDYRYVWATAYGGEQRFVATLLTIALGLVCYLLSFHTVRYRKKSSDTAVFSEPHRHVSIAILVTFVAIGLLLKLYLVFATGGIEATISRLSGAVQTSERVEDLNSGQLGIRTLSGLADAGAVYMLIQALRERKYVRISGFIFAAVFILSFMTMGKRLSLILPALAVVLALHTYIRPITIKYAPAAIVATISLGMVTLLTRILVPASQNGTVVDFEKIPYAQGSVLKFYFYSLEFSSVEMMTVTRVSANKITNMFGGIWESFFQTNVTPILFTIPRAIWQGKPTEIYDVSYAISSALDGTQLSSTDVGYASTYIGTSFVFGGLTGVAVSSVLLGWLTARIDIEFTDRVLSPPAVIAYALFITIAFHAFRQGTIGWTFIVSIIQQYGLLLGVLAIMLFRQPPETKGAKPIHSTEKNYTKKVGRMRV